MVYTNFPNGLTSFGIPVVPGVPLPFTGDYYFVDPVNGSDGNTGGAEDPLRTLSRAHTLCTAGQNDVVILIGNGATSGSARESATLVWSKDATHLIGVSAPTAVAQRSRIAATSGVNFTPLVSVTAAGCMFLNISAFHGYDAATAQVCWNDSGERNYYGNVCFQGMGHATAGAQAGGRSLVISGSGKGEHTFDGCTIGLDTVARTTTNASLEFSGGTPRNLFRNCIFPAYATNAGALFVTVAAAAAIDRWEEFDQCTFINSVKSGSGTAMTGAFNVAASAGGLLLLKRCTIVGATDIEASASNEIFIDGGPPTSTTTALAINNA